MKKKVSFDIEEEDLNNVRKYCEIKKLKMSDFLRTAAVEKWKRDDSSFIIFVIFNSQIKKFAIEEHRYDYDIFIPGAELQELGATGEGTIGFKNSKEFAVKNELDNLILESPTGRVRYFTK